MKIKLAPEKIRMLFVAAIGVISSISAVVLTNHLNSKQDFRKNEFSYENQIINKRLEIIDRAAKVFGKSPGISDFWLMYIKNTKIGNSENQASFSVTEKLTDYQGEFQSILWMSEIFFGPETKKSIANMGTEKGPWWEKSKDKQEKYINAMLSELTYGLSNFKTKSHEETFENGSKIDAVIDFLKAGLTPLIGIIAAYIAWQQWKTNASKLKLEKYDRRLKIYQIIQRFICEVTSSAQPKLQNIFKFASDVAEVDFLFEKDIRDHVDEIHNHAMSLYTSNNKSQAPSMNQSSGDDANAINQEIISCMQWFINASEKTKIIFSKYLLLTE